LHSLEFQYADLVSVYEMIMFLTGMLLDNSTQLQM